MYTARIINETEKENYNKFVSAHPKGHFSQLWEWGQVKKSMGWEPLPLVLEYQDEIQAAMLILKKRLPLLPISFFYSPRGPVMDTNHPELMRELLNGAAITAQEHRAIFLKIDPDIEKENRGFVDILTQNGWKINQTGLDFDGVQPKFVFRLSIRADEKALLDNMHSKWRYNIRLAERKGVSIRPAADEEDLKVFYDILQETARRDNFLIRDYGYFKCIWDCMVANDYARVFLAEYEGRVISAALTMISGEKAWYLYGASSNEDRNVMPNYLIQWEMIRWAKNSGCTLYDFRGVSGDLDENNPLYGLYRFKKGFGGTFTEFIGEWDMVYSRFFTAVWKLLLPLYMKIR